MKILRLLAVASAAFFYVGSASAQWQTPDHSVPIGRGSGTGFKFAAPGTAGHSLVSNGASSDPTFQVIAGPAFGTQTANTVFSGPTSGGAANPTFRALVGADLPNPSASSLGGVQSKTAVTSQWLNSISTSGVPSSSQPAFTDISGTATAAQGGTGQSTFVIGDLLQANATNTLARLAAVATGNVLISGGVGTVSSWGKVGLTTHVTGTLPVANGGTNCAVASGTCVDNISGFASTGFLTRTGAGTYAFQSATNGITRGNLAQVAANSFSGNATTSIANESAFTITSLTSKAAPVSGDLVVIEDSAASGQLKKATVGSIASAGSVASYNGRTGAVTAIGTDVPVRGYISGLTLSAAGSTATFGIAAGVSTDSTSVSMMSLASAYTKTTSAWAVGSGNGALDTSTIAINNWYYVYQIQRPDTGVVDICISASPTAPTFGGNIPAAYTLYRRIGAILTDASSQWRKFSQIGDEFLWDVPSRDLNGGNIAAGPGSLVNLLVPNQIKVRAFVSVEYGTAGTVFGLVTSPDQADTAAGTTNFNMIGSATNTNAMFYGEIRTNASGQIRVRTDVAITGNAYVFNRGWSDTRGKDN